MVAGVVGQGLSIYEALRKSVATTKVVDVDVSKPLEPGGNGALPVRPKETA